MASGKTEGEDVATILETLRNMEKFGISDRGIVDNLKAQLQAKTVHSSNWTAGQVRI